MLDRITRTRLILGLDQRTCRNCKWGGPRAMACKHISYKRMRDFHRRSSATKSPKEYDELVGDLCTFGEHWEIIDA